LHPGRVVSKKLYRYCIVIGERIALKQIKAYYDLEVKMNNFNKIEVILAEIEALLKRKVSADGGLLSNPITGMRYGSWDVTISNWDEYTAEIDAVYKGGKTVSRRYNF